MQCFFSSSEPKAQVSSSDQNLYVVRRRSRRCRFRLCCCKIFTFSSSPEPLGQFQQNLEYLSLKGIQVYSNEGLCPFSRRDNHKIAKIH